MTAIDPVCGMSVEEDSAAATAEYKGGHLLLLQRQLQEGLRGRPRGVPAEGLSR